MNVLKKITGWLVLAMTLILAAGCGITNPTNTTNGTDGSTAVVTETLNVGDLISIAFSGVEAPPAAHEERIKQDGTITLSLIGSVEAKGKTPGQLQKKIRDLYLKYYKDSLNVTVKWQERFFFVGGQVKSGGRLLWSEGMTLVKAIQTAGGFIEEWAKTTKVRVTRLDGKTFIVNYDKATIDQKFDVPIYPGDTINVPKRW